jgi:UrcA family protein
MFTGLNTVAFSTAAPRLAGALALTFVSLLIAVSPALAESPRAAEVPSVTVRYADLNLDQQAGVKQLHKRLQVAAENVCGTPVSPGRRFVSDAWKVCVEDALESAIVKVDSPALTAYHLGIPQYVAAIQTASAR